MIDVFFSGYGYWRAVIGKQKFLGIEQDAYCALSNDYKAEGVFSLTDEDERVYRHTQDFEKIKVVALLPSEHHDDEFSRMEKKGEITHISNDNIHFYLSEEQPEPITLKIATPYEPPRIVTQSETFTEKERNTMLKLIIGMAMDAYNYDPNSTRNSLTGDKNGLSSKLELKNITISDDTIRKYLNEAKKLI